MKIFDWYYVLLLQWNSVDFVNKSGRLSVGLNQINLVKFLRFGNVSRSWQVMEIWYLCLWQILVYLRLIILSIVWQIKKNIFLLVTINHFRLTGVFINQILPIFIIMTRPAMTGANRIISLFRSIWNTLALLSNNHSGFDLFARLRRWKLIWL